jgi:hypothetical protein
MTAIVVIALILAILSVVSSGDAMIVVSYALRFFTAMIPVLAVGGLLKWIFCAGKCCKCGSE